MCNLAAKQALEDYTDDFAPKRQHPVGDFAHHTDAGPAIDQSDASCVHGLRQLAGGLSVFGIAARAGPAKDTNGFHR